LKRFVRAAASAAVVLACAVFCPIVLLAAESPPQDRTARPLRNEDVVRMLVAGRPAAEIVAAIRSADVSFDLSDEMAQELRVAGVPEGVLSAMRARQAEVDRARQASGPPDAASEAPAAGKSAVVVTIRLDDHVARTLQAGASDEERKVTDLAMYLTCRTPDHVPDQWRSKSPLGRDFVSVSRHELLDFRRGASPLPAKKPAAGPGPPALPGEQGASEGGELVLALPIELRGEIETGVPHDLVIGAGRFLQLVEARKDGVVPGASGLALAAVLTERGRRRERTLELKFEDGAPAGASAR
jgi:hypothetical protein